ncbi:MAG TPA: MBL fold metallo-hydrolase, partial [Candidatus Dormibacteraeota bacterium]|nr:MBL fold metallo-hydrolase [Candidatus Dormibacteraeota bacterium]
MGVASAAWREVGDGVLVRRYPFLDQSIGIVLGPEGVLVVDTRSSAGQAEEIRRAVRELTALPIVAAVDTHHHWDHSFGNRALRPIPIWGHARCARRLVESAEAMREAHAAEAPGIGEVVVDPPDRTFEEHAVVEITGRRVELRYLGRGHTDDDIVALVTDAGILFAGDLLENGAPPWYGDAYPLDWPETASRLLEL